MRVTENVGGALMIIDARNERGADWYTSYGPAPLRGRPLTLVVPLPTFAETSRASGHI